MVDCKDQASDNKLVDKEWIFGEQRAGDAQQNFQQTYI